MRIAPRPAKLSFGVLKNKKGTRVAAGGTVPLLEFRMGLEKNQLSNFSRFRVHFTMALTVVGFQSYAGIPACTDAWSIAQQLEAGIAKHISSSHGQDLFRKVQEQLPNQTGPGYAPALPSSTIASIPLGLYGLLEERHTDVARPKKIKVTRNEDQIALRRRIHLQQRSAQINEILPDPRIRQAFDKFIDLGDWVYVCIQNSHFKRILQGESQPVHGPIETAIRNKLQTAFIFTAARAYLNSALVPNLPMTGYKLMNGFTDPLIRLWDLSQYFLFSKPIWNAIEREMSAVLAWQGKPQSKSEVSQALRNLDIPYFPSLIVMGEQNARDPRQIEFSRLSANDWPDPLGLIDAEQPQNHRLFEKLMNLSLEHYPEAETVFAEAHTPIHERHYLSMQFTPLGSVYSQLWNREVTRLSISSEKFKAYLNR
jgi:hypothetical protein